MRFRQACMDDAVNLAALTTQVWLDTYAVYGIRDALSAYVFQVHIKKGKTEIHPFSLSLNPAYRQTELFI